MEWYGACRQVVKTSDCGSDMHGFESHQAPHKKDFGICQGLFYLSDEGENPFEGSSEERAECGGVFFGRNAVSEKKIRRHV